MAEFWTTEQVAAHLNIDVSEVYRTRRNGEWPGSVGRNRGRRLLFPSDLIESGPQEPETTNDPLEAILWTLQGIEAKVAQMAADVARFNDITIPEAAQAIQNYYFGEIEETSP